MNRRALLGGLAGVVATAITGAAIARRGAGLNRRASSDSAPVIRIGVMANLTHAPLLAGLGSGRVARALAPWVIESRIFRAGPRVTEALIGDAIDVGTAGPAAVVVHHARHRNTRYSSSGGLRIWSGCCSGGASLIVTRASAIAKASDLRGKRVAITQIGTTQDIALRMYLHEAGLRDTASGGDVTVLAIAGSTILDQMRRGDLHAAWLPEPWATRVVHDLSGIRFVDERDLWPERRFSTAVLATRAEMDLTAAAAASSSSKKISAGVWMPTLVHALDEEVERARTDPRSTVIEAHTELKRHLGNPGSLALFQEASAFVDFTSDAIPSSIKRFGDAAAAFGLCPANPTQGLFVGGTE